MSVALCFAPCHAEPRRFTIKQSLSLARLSFRRIDSPQFGSKLLRAFRDTCVSKWLSGSRHEGSRVARAGALGGAACRFLIFFPPNLSQILREMLRGKGCVNSHPFFLVECTLSHSTLQQACYASPSSGPSIAPSFPLSFLPSFQTRLITHAFLCWQFYTRPSERGFSPSFSVALPSPYLPLPSLPPSPTYN